MNFEKIYFLTLTTATNLMSTTGMTVHERQPAIAVLALTAPAQHLARKHVYLNLTVINKSGGTITMELPSEASTYLYGPDGKLVQTDISYTCKPLSGAGGAAIDINRDVDDRSENAFRSEYRTLQPNGIYTFGVDLSCLYRITQLGLYHFKTSMPVQILVAPRTPTVRARSEFIGRTSATGSFVMYP